MPRVSVIMPVYNAEENHLREAILSILKQTYTDFELIILNDGSTNNSEEVIKSFDDPRIVYVKNDKNLKIIKTLNKGLELAKGEYIARMDSDDISDTRRLEIQVKYLDEHPKVALAGTWAVAFPVKIKYRLPTHAQDIKMFLRYCSNCIIHPTVMVRKSVLAENNLKYDEAYPHAEDYKLWCDLSEKYDLANIPEVLFAHRLHTTSVSALNARVQQNISDKILFECLIKDFGADEIVVKAIEAYLNSKTISSKSLWAVGKWLGKIAEQIYREIFEQGRRDIIARYSNIWKKFILMSEYNTRFIFTLYLSPISKFLGITTLQKLSLHMEKLSNNRGR